MPQSVIVADIGGTKIALGHVTHGELAATLSSVSSDLLRVPDPVMALSELLQQYALEAQLTIGAVVLGVPVSLDRDLDTVLSSPNIPQLDGVRLGTGLHDQLEVPVFLERDINLLLLGEYRAGAAQRASSALGVFFGTGVGASFLMDGKPYRGHSVGLELGHIPVRLEGRICVCGNVDCLEAYACGHTLRELSAQFAVPVEELFTRASEQPDLEQAIADFVRDQARAVATAINLFDPEIVVIGGGVPQMQRFPQDRFLETVLRHLRRPYPRDSVTLRWAELGSGAMLHGALAVLEQRG